MIMASSWKYSLACSLLLAATCLIWGCSSAPEPTLTSRGSGDVDIVDEYPRMKARFDLWMRTHNRSYPNSEEKRIRFNIYKRNMRYIEDVNDDPTLTYELGEGPFTDLTNEEFMGLYTSLKGEPEKDEGDDDDLITTHAGPVDGGAPLMPSTEAVYMNLSAGAPRSIDWRSVDAVTRVKNQGKCGCGWAFAAVATVESLQMTDGKELVSLSEQQLLDCIKTDKKLLSLPKHSSDCCGGASKIALKWIVYNGGVTTESNYHYKAAQGTCKTKDYMVEVYGYRHVRRNCERSLMNAVVNQPVAVSIKIGGGDFQHYKRGVYNGPCGTKLNHAVAVVGYGQYRDGTKYWIAKNSWGTQWGNRGYIKIEKDINKCGIALRAYYPLM